MIAAIKQSINIPLIANGDVDSYASLKHIHQQTGADGFMVARASVGQPWIFKTLLANDTQQEALAPPPEAVGKIFTRHLHGLSDLLSEKVALLEARKLAKYYAKHSGIDAKFLTAFYQVESLTEAKDLILKFFKKSSST